MMGDEFVITVLGIIFTIGVPVVLGSILGFIYIRGRNAERIAMIERGVIPQEIAKPEKRANRYPALRNGLVMIGIAVGVLIGFLIAPFIEWGWVTLVILSMALLFGGIGFVTYFFLSRKMEHQDDAYEQTKQNN